MLRTPGEILSELSRELGRSIPDIARMSGYGRPQAFYDVISGKTRHITPKMAGNIVRAFPQVNRNTLICGEGKLFNAAPGFQRNSNPGAYSGSDASQHGLSCSDCGSHDHQAGSDSYQHELDGFDSFCPESYGSDRQSGSDASQSGLNSSDSYSNSDGSDRQSGSDISQHGLSCSDCGSHDHQAGSDSYQHELDGFDSSCPESYGSRLSSSRSEPGVHSHSSVGWYSPVSSIHYIPLVPISAQGGPLNDFVVSVNGADCEKIVSPICGADFAITVNGDSMAPEFPCGSQVLVKKINALAFIEWGKTYVLDTCNGTVIKKLVPSTSEGCVRCLSVNPSPEFAPFDICMEDVYGFYRVIMCMSLK